MILTTSAIILTLLFSSDALICETVGDYNDNQQVDTMALPDFTTQDAATYKANIDLTADDHETRIDAVETSGFRGALVYGSTSVATGVTTHLNFNNESYDTDSIHDNVTNNQRLTVPSGVTKIKLSAQASFADGTTGIRILSISKNDETTTPTLVSGLPSLVTAGTGASGGTVSVSSSVIAVVAGDYFTAAAFQDSGGSMTAGLFSTSGYTYFAMEIIE